MAKKIIFIVSFVVVGFLGLGLFQPEAGFSYDNSVDDPLVKDAQQALDTRDVTPVLKWVKADAEQDVVDAFHLALEKRLKRPDASEGSDKLFFEKLVLFHREGQGSYYTGLRPGGEQDLIIVKAEQALEMGVIKPLIDALHDEMAFAIKKKFAYVRDKKTHADDNVEAGREYVDAYVSYIQYIVNLSNAIAGVNISEEPKKEKSE